MEKWFAARLQKASYSSLKKFLIGLSNLLKVEGTAERKE